MGVIYASAMRPRPLLLLTLAFLLTPAAPAMAAEFTVDVVDFSFAPREQQIAPGDSVTWTFTAGGHTATASGGQADRWDSSSPSGDFNAPGDRFTHTFNRPGRFQYICIPHASFMRGTIQVGEDQVQNTVGAITTSRRGNRVAMRFRLNEAAKATYKLRGPSRRTVTRRRLGAGRQSIAVRNLEPGRYRGTLTTTDDFDKRDTARNSFVVR
jgi:plastocyanin